MLPIRYSASGPIITNDDGGEATPGEGFQLRLADNQASAGALVLDGTNQPVPGSGGSEFAVALANPKPGRRYAANLTIVLANNSAASAAFVVGAQWRVDGGAWVQSPDFFSYSQNSATIASMCCVFDTRLRLGSALVAPVLDASALLEVQFTARVSAGTGIQAGQTVYARLIETL
jgi:hypothetical protein